MRGVKRQLTVEGVVERARSMIAFRPQPPVAHSKSRAKPIQYRLRGGFNGGKDPFAQHPGSWSPPDNQKMPWSSGGAWTCDCSGFVSWCLGIDRYQPEFPHYGGWVSTDSILMDARTGGDWFEEIPAPELGCVVVYGGARRKGKRIRVGHVGLVVDPLPAEWDKNWSDLRVIHCSSGNGRRFGQAVWETDGRIWSKHGRLVRAKFLKEDDDE